MNTKQKNGTKLYFDHQNINDQEVQYAYKQVRANELASLFNSWDCFFNLDVIHFNYDVICKTIYNL